MCGLNCVRCWVLDEVLLGLGGGMMCV
jgi:hypothetical protein